VEVLHTQGDEVSATESRFMSHVQYFIVLGPKWTPNSKSK